jgi:hypothetical protein
MFVADGNHTVACCDGGSSAKEQQGFRLWGAQVIVSLKTHAPAAQQGADTVSPATISGRRKAMQLSAFMLNSTA